MSRSNAVAAALIAVATLIAVLAVWGTPWVTNDSLWALAWGGELVHGHAPSFAEPGVSTPHPLTNLIAAAARLSGATGGYWTVAAVGLVCFAVIVALVFLAGVAVSGLGRARPAGGVAALRCVRGRPALAIALTLAAPVTWLGVDAITTGNALHSLTHTQEGARDLRRTTGLSNVPGTARGGLEVLLTWPVLLGGGAGFALALVACRRARPLLAVGLIGGITYLLLGVADLSLLDRYLLLPAIVLAFGFAYAVTGWAAQTGWARAGWAAGAAVLAVYALTAAPGRLHALRTAEARGAANAELVASLRRFDDSATLTRALRRCDRVAVRDQRGRALLVDELGVPVDRVVDARRTPVGAGDVFVTVDDRTMREEQPALFPAHPTPPAAAPPAGFRVIAAHEGWRALAGPACR